MIFIAGNADASASNLGQIVIKTVGDISQFTTDLLALFGKAWGDEQIVEIDNFFEKLSLAPWKGKVKAMVIPVLIPPVNNVTDSVLTLSGSVYRKNLVDLYNQLTVSAGLLNGVFGYLGVTDKGYVLQNGSSGVHDNAGITYLSTSLNVSNRSAHYGVYYTTPTKFRAGAASPTSPYLLTDGTKESAMIFNSFQTGNIPNPAPHANLLLLNGKVSPSAGKSYVKNTLITTSILGVTTEAVMDSFSAITSGGANVINESACAFVTFGDYLEDTEVSQYSAMINQLMGALLV